jgi:hypothetical protein
MAKFEPTSTVIINGEEKLCKFLTLEEIKVLFNEYKEKHGKYPNSCTCMSKEKDNLPPWDIVQNNFRKNNMSLNQFLEFIGNFEAIKPDPNKYYDYVEIFKKHCFLENRLLTRKDYLHNNLGIPDVRWFINHCPNKDIKNYNQFLEWIGLVPYNGVSKEMAIKAIYFMSKKLDRPLMYDDFRSPKFNEIGIGTVKKYWKNMNGMKLDLGLEIIQEDMTCKKITLEQAKEDIKKLCDYVYEIEGRKTITTTDVSKIKGLLDFATYRNYLRENNENIRDYIASLGFELQKEGRGFVYNFEDGEVTKSKYELDFSQYLRNDLNLKYNIDYIRDVRYNTFIDDYNELMDCDYIINYKDRKVYIEIAGILRDLHNYYYDNKPINSKSKEYYRLKLMKKEQMLKNIDCEYYILFPINKNYKSVMDFDFINGIFNK